MPDVSTRLGRLKLHIIHLPHRTDRYTVLMNELSSQQVSDYQFFDGYVDKGYAPNGIALAHKQVIRHAKRTGLEQVLVCEDDIQFTDQGALDYFLNHVPDDFDMYLGGIYYGQLHPGNLAVDFSGLTLYVMHERFYDTFLSIPFGNHIDRSLNGRGKYVVCDPFVVRQYNGYSDNVRKTVNYDSYLAGRRFYQKS